MISKVWLILKRTISVVGMLFTMLAYLSSASADRVDNDFMALDQLLTPSHLQLNNWSASNSRYTFFLDMQGLNRIDERDGEASLLVPGDPNEKATVFVHIDDEYLFFLQDQGAEEPADWTNNISGAGALIRLDEAGNSEVIIDYLLGDPCVADGRVYYQEDMQTIKCVDLDGQNDSVFVKANRIESFRMLPDMVSVYTGDSTILYAPDGELLREMDGYVRMGGVDYRVRYPHGTLHVHTLDDGRLRLDTNAFNDFRIDDVQFFHLMEDGVFCISNSTTNPSHTIRDLFKLQWLEIHINAPSRVDAFGRRTCSSPGVVDGKLYFLSDLDMPDPVFYEMDLSTRNSQLQKVADIDSQGCIPNVQYAGKWAFFYDDAAGYGIYFNKFFGRCKLDSPADLRTLIGPAFEALPPTLRYTASSVLLDDSGNSCDTDNLRDGNKNTVWAEGVDGYGIGESVSITGNRSFWTSGFTIDNGFQKDDKTFLQYSCAKQLDVYADNRLIGQFTLSSNMGTQTLLFDEPVNGLIFRFEIAAVYKGTKYADTSISELELVLDTIKNAHHQADSPDEMYQPEPPIEESETQDIVGEVDSPYYETVGSEPQSACLDAYAALIAKTEHRYFLLYDIDKDGIAELFLYEASDSPGSIDVYSFDGSKSLYLGELGASSGLATLGVINGQLCYGWAGSRGRFVQCMVQRVGNQIVAGDSISEDEFDRSDDPNPILIEGSWRKTLTDLMQSNGWEYGSETGVTVPGTYVDYDYEEGDSEYPIDDEWALIVASDPDSVSDNGFFCPDSDILPIMPDDLANASKATLAYVRNEILARHGYPFEKKSYRSYFGSKRWYQRIEGEFDYSILNPVESENIEAIKRWEG